MAPIPTCFFRGMACSTLAWTCRLIKTPMRPQIHMLTTSVKHGTLVAYFVQLAGRNAEGIRMLKNAGNLVESRRPIVRQWRLVLCCLMCTASVHARADETVPIKDTLRVLTYNIHHGEGIDGKLDLARIAAVIRSAEPDIVALQEVDQKAERTGKVDQPAELSKLTGMNVAFGDNIKLQGGSYGNAVLSRFPIKRHENHPLPPFDKGERRGLFEVEVELPGERSLLFFATHLDHQRSPKDRNAAAEIITQRSAPLERRPALLAGDLNDGPSSVTLTILAAAGWTRSNTQPMATVPVKSPLRQIDFILFRPEKEWRVIETRVLDEAVASDHRGVLAILHLAPPDRSQIR